MLRGERREEKGGGERDFGQVGRGIVDIIGIGSECRTPNREFAIDGSRAPHLVN